jgi:hypothetical protein
MALLKPPPEESKRLKKACGACPYSKTVVPGALGGSDPDVYVGQGHGPFYLPCHKTCDFDNPDWKTDSQTPLQCAGAAIYRANIDRAKLMPLTLHTLPKDDSCFGSPEELLAHHKGISIVEATEYLKHNTPDMLMYREFYRAGL